MGIEELTPFGEDELTLILMGPGFGESVLIRWPPADWFVVDSFRRIQDRRERHPGVDAIALFEAAPAAVALTHPHQDHSAGFEALIARRRDGGRVGWLAEPDKSAWWATPDSEQATRQGATEHAIAAIERVWDEDPDSRWDLFQGSPPLVLGEATIEVLSPEPGVVEQTLATRDPDLNRISSAMLITWRNCQILLGADLTNPGWDALEVRHGPLHLSQTAGMKIAHHGSEEAQHAVALGEPPPRERLSIASPYNRGHKVPDFAAGQDVEQLLNVTSRLYLTTHHGRLPPDSGTTEVRRADVPAPQRRIGRRAVALNTTRPALSDCWVAATFTPDGGLASVRRGSASLCVIP